MKRVVPSMLKINLINLAQIPVLSLLVHTLSELVVFRVQSIDVSLSRLFSVSINQFWQTSQYKKPNQINYSTAPGWNNLQGTLFAIPWWHKVEQSSILPELDRVWMNATTTWWGTFLLSSLTDFKDYHLSPFYGDCFIKFLSPSIIVFGRVNFFQSISRGQKWPQDTCWGQNWPKEPFYVIIFRNP